jgi:hypothetical protein
LQADDDPQNGFIIETLKKVSSPSKDNIQDASVYKPMFSNKFGPTVASIGDSSLVYKPMFSNKFGPTVASIGDSSLQFFCAQSRLAAQITLQSSRDTARYTTDHECETK